VDEDEEVRLTRPPYEPGCRLVPIPNEPSICFAMPV
jgi:hypothetical protein